MIFPVSNLAETKRRNFYGRIDEDYDSAKP